MARQVLGNEIYQEAFNTVRDRLVTMLESADLPADKRERINNLLIQHRRVRVYMETVMTTGKLAAEQIERDKTFAERMKSRFS